MELKTALIFLFFATFGCFAKIDEDLFGAQGSELLKELKESGVIDQFEQELEKMLQEQGGDLKEKVEEVLKGQEELKKEVNPVTEFINSYVEEKKIHLDSRILEHLANLDFDGNEAKHFVHLTGVLDKIYELGKLDDPKIDQKVLDIIKRVKSLPVMKTSLNKLVDEEPEVKVEEPAKKTNEVFDNSMIKMATDFIKGLKEKPEFVIEVLLPMLKQYNVVGDEVIQMAKIYGKTLVRSEGFTYFIDSLVNFIENFATSKSGLRLIQLIPELMNISDKETLIEVVRKEVESTWDEFMSHIENSDHVEGIVNSLAGTTVQTIDYVKILMKDEMKMAIANTFLISQGLPSIKPRKLTESIFDLADKCIKVFTTWKFDLQEYKKETLKYINLLEKEYISASEFGKLTSSEQKTLIARFLRENMIDPFNYLMSIRKLIFFHPEGQKCAKSLLCHLNSHMKKQGTVKSEVTKVFSLAATYGWTYDGSMDKFELYQAIWNGHKPETDCSIQYTPSGKENICHILPWQSGMMSLNFEHNEL